MEKRVTVDVLRRMKREGAKITMLTAYDHPFAEMADGAGMDMILVGDSVGTVVQGLPDTLAQYGATKVYVADDPALEAYSSEGYTNALDALIGKVEPAIILLGATAMGKDLAPRLAARLGVGLASSLSGVTTTVTQPASCRPNVLLVGKHRAWAISPVDSNASHMKSSIVTARWRCLRLCGPRSLTSSTGSASEPPTAASELVTLLMLARSPLGLRNTVISPALTLPLAPSWV